MSLSTPVLWIQTILIRIEPFTLMPLQIRILLYEVKSLVISYLYIRVIGVGAGVVFFRSVWGRICEFQVGVAVHRRYRYMYLVNTGVPRRCIGVAVRRRCRCMYLVIADIPRRCIGAAVLRRFIYCRQYCRCGSVMWLYVDGIAVSRNVDVPVEYFVGVNLLLYLVGGPFWCTVPHRCRRIS
jgi:hypothetical protein